MDLVLEHTQRHGQSPATRLHGQSSSLQIPILDVLQVNGFHLMDLGAIGPIGAGMPQIERDLSAIGPIGAGMPQIERDLGAIGPIGETVLAPI